MALPKIPPKFVVELSRPTILNLAALVCYCLAMLFHVIAYTTSNWSTLKLEGVEWQMGLWYGCRHNTTDDTWFCSSDVFNDKVFKTGSNWHLGSQIMMTFALVVLFLLEFAVIGYACIKRLERHKDRMVGTVIALSVTAAFCHFLVLIMYGTEVDKIRDSFVQGSFGIVIICMFLEIILPVLVKVDKHKRFPKDGALKEVRRQLRQVGIRKSDLDPTRKENVPKRTSIPKGRQDEAEDADKHKIRKLSASELEKRFPPYQFDNLGYYPPVSMRTSATSVTGGRTNSVGGSAPSLLTQSTVVTGVSYDRRNSDMSSVESFESLV